MSTRRMVILDRDGTINAERHYLATPDQLELLPGAAEAIRRLRELGLPVVVITNQSAIARGYFDQGALRRVHARFEEMLAEQGTSVDAIYVCPHGPDDGCRCRKPRPALALEAAAAFGADLGRSFVVGDKASDVELGAAVGARTVLVRTGYGEEAARSGRAAPDHCAEDLRAAAEWIAELLARDGARPAG